MTKEEKANQEKEWLQLVKKIADCRSKNLTWQQVAEKLGMTISSVKSHWHRRKHLLEEETKTEVYKADRYEEPISETQAVEEAQADEVKTGKGLRPLEELLHNEWQSSNEDADRTQPGTSTSDKQPCVNAAKSHDVESRSPMQYFAFEAGGMHLSHSMQEMQNLVALYDVHYLIDTENVNTPAISNLAKNLRPNELLHLFYSDNSKGLPYAVLEILLQKPEQIQLEYCVCGTPNAMDFQIVTILGFMTAACEPKRNKFRIITDDRGYDAVVQYWKWKGMPVDRISSGSIPSMLEHRCMSADEVARMYLRPVGNSCLRADERRQVPAQIDDIANGTLTDILAMDPPEKPRAMAEETVIKKTPDQEKAKKKNVQAAQPRKTDKVSQAFHDANSKKQERWVQVMASFYGSFCKKHKVKATKATVNARILLEHPDYRKSDFANDASAFLQKVPAAEIAEARENTYRVCAK